MKLLKKHWFVAGLIVAIGLAIAAPGLGQWPGPLSPAAVSRAAVFVIFVINGLILPSESILSGLAKWRVHVFVHAFLFVVTPLLLLVLLAPVRPFLDGALVSGFILLSALPCTISTSIVYAVRAGGSLAPAIFNATAANLVGVVLTPLIVGALAPNPGGNGIDPSRALTNTTLMVLPPILLGQILRQPIRAWATRMKPHLNHVTSALILVVAFLAFASSAGAGLWAKVGLLPVLITAGLCVLFFLGQTTLASAGTHGMKFAPDDAVTAFVCSTQKTLAAGIPLAHAIFAGTPVDIGVVLLPLLIFYAIQLIFGDFAIRVFCRPAI